MVNTRREEKTQKSHKKVNNLKEKKSTISKHYHTVSKHDTVTIKMDNVGKETQSGDCFKNHTVLFNNNSLLSIKGIFQQTHSMSSNGYGTNYVILLKEDVEKFISGIQVKTDLQLDEPYGPYANLEGIKVAISSATKNTVIKNGTDETSAEEFLQILKGRGVDALYEGRLVIRTNDNLNNAKLIFRVNKIIIKYHTFYPEIIPMIPESGTKSDPIPIE